MTDGSNNPVRKIEITRDFDAPRERVFRAWTDADEFAQWWGPAGSHSPRESVAVDARKGGSWRSTIVTEEDGSEVHFFGVYHEVVAPERLVFSLVDPDDPDFEARKQEEGPVEEAISVAFADVDGKTRMTFSQTGHLPESEIQRATEGWSSFFDCLADHLAKS